MVDSPATAADSDEARRPQAVATLKIERDHRGRPTGRRRRRGGLLLLVAVLAGAAVALRALTAPPTLRTVSVLRISPIADRELTTANGYVVARTRASVASKSQGRLASVLVDEGDEVAPGQVLAVVEHDEVDATLAEAAALVDKAQRAVPVAEAELSEAEAAVRVVEAGLAERRAAVVEAEAVLAEREASYARTADLVERQIHSGAELDRAREQRDVARAQATLALTTLETAEQEVVRATAAVDVARRRVDLVRQDVRVAQAARARAEATREHAFIKAPFAGTVLRREAEPGEVVSPANTGASGSKTAVVTLADFATLEVEVDVYERDIGRITAGSPCRIQLDAYPDERLRGQVRLLRPTADRSRATVQVYVRFDAIPAAARPEMGARVSFYAAGTDVLTPDQLSLPVAAVVERGAGTGVFVVADGVARFRAVEFGARSEVDGVARREIVRGLEAGERVAVEPPDDLQDGDPVAVEEG